MDKLILKLLEQKLRIAKYDLLEYWLDIGRPDDYEKAKDVFNKNFINNVENKKIICEKIKLTYNWRYRNYWKSLHQKLFRSF